MNGTIKIDSAWRKPHPSLAPSSSCLTVRNDDGTVCAAGLSQRHRFAIGGGDFAMQMEIVSEMCRGECRADVIER